MVTCGICGKELYSRQSLGRHMTSMHPDQADEDSNGETNQYDEKDSSDEKSSDDEDTNEYDDALKKDDSDDDSSIWEDLLEDVMQEDDNIRDADGELKWSKVLKRVKEKVTDWLDTATRIRNSGTFDKIQMEEERLTKRGYSEVEARHAAWSNRKFLIKGLLKRLERKWVNKEIQILGRRMNPKLTRGKRTDHIVIIICFRLYVCLLFKIKICNYYHTNRCKNLTTNKTVSYEKMCHHV
jgi:hypothetical protein